MTVSRWPTTNSFTYVIENGVGGTSTGTVNLVVYASDGTPYFIAKMNGVNTSAPSGHALDADWSGDDLENWSDSTDFPIQVADSTDDPDYEVGQVLFPPTGPDGEFPRFFRVTVELVR